MSNLSNFKLPKTKKSLSIRTILSVVFAVFAVIPYLLIFSVSSKKINEHYRYAAKETASAINGVALSRVKITINGYSELAKELAKTETAVQYASGNYVDYAEFNEYVAELIGSSELQAVYIGKSDNTVFPGIGGGTTKNVFPFDDEKMASLAKNDVYVSEVNYDVGEETSYITFIKYISTEDDVNIDGTDTYIALDVRASFPHSQAETKKTDVKSFLIDHNGNCFNISKSVASYNLPEDKKIAENIAESVFSDTKIGDKIGTGFAAGNVYAVSNVSRLNFRLVSFYNEKDYRSDATKALIVPIFAGIIAIFLIIMVNFYFLAKTAVPIKKIINKCELLLSSKADASDLNTSYFHEYRIISEILDSVIPQSLESESTYRMITNISGEILFDWNIKSEKLFVSDNFSKLFDFDPANSKLTENFINQVMDSDFSKKYLSDMLKLLDSKDSIVAEYKIMPPHSSSNENEISRKIWISVNARAIVDRFDKKTRIIGLIKDIDEDKQLEITLQNQASIDFLTGLFNRVTFLRMLTDELQRDAFSPVAIIFIDVDDFKFINDRYSHSAGDEIIIHVAKVLKQTIGGNGFAGRFGGDEFVACVTNPETTSNMNDVGYKLIQTFAKGYHLVDFGVTIKIKASIGIAVSPKHGRETDLLVSHADEAMYFVKKNGKSNYHIYTGDENTGKSENTVTEIET